MKTIRFKNLILFLASIPLGILMNYYITSDLLFYISIFSSGIYFIIIPVQIIFIYEIMKYFFISWNKYDKALIAVIYFSALIFMLFARTSLGERIFQWNPIGFINDLQNGSSRELLIPFFNVLMFIPMPIVCSFFCKDRKKVKCYCLILAVSIEVIQVATMRGMFDLSDIVLYIIGITIGFPIMRFLEIK